MLSDRHADLCHEVRRKPNLDVMLAALGARRVEADDLPSAGRYALIAVGADGRGGRSSVGDVAVTRAEAEDPAYGYFMRGMGYLAHVRTHASSVVMDMTKAMLLNPSYGPRSAKPLRKARRHLTEREYALVVADARQQLELGRG